MQSKIFAAITISVLTFMTCQCDVQSAKSARETPALPTPPANVIISVNSNTKSSEDSSDEKPADEGTIEGKPSDSAIADSKLETILRQPLPEIWFVFACQNDKDSSAENCVDGRTKKEISPEIKELAEKRWRECLRFSYLDLNKKFSNPQELMDAETVYINENRKFHSALKKLLVEAPNGKRLVSDNEAYELLSYIMQTAKETVQSAR